MKPLLLMLHGWGFDRHFWRMLQDELSDFKSVTWDLGFFGPADFTLPEVHQPVIAIGHSYGLVWLLQHRPLAWQALVAINGFSRFPGGPPLDRMIAAFDRAPRATLDNFRKRCGAPSPAPEPLIVARLRDGLDHLRRWDQSSARIDLALCGESDPIVAPAHHFNPDHICWHPGGHLLPLSDPVWCAKQLREFLT